MASLLTNAYQSFDAFVPSIRGVGRPVGIQEQATREEELTRVRVKRIARARQGLAGGRYFLHPRIEGVGFENVAGVIDRQAQWSVELSRLFSFGAENCELSAGGR